MIQHLMNTFNMWFFNRQQPFLFGEFLRLQANHIAIIVMESVERSSHGPEQYSGSAFFWIIPRKVLHRSWKEQRMRGLVDFPACERRRLPESKSMELLWICPEYECSPTVADCHQCRHQDYKT